MSATQSSLERLHARIAVSRVGGMAVETVQRATAVRVPRMAAALVFYLLLSIAPLLVVVVGMAGLVVGQQATAIYDEILDGMSDVVGARAAEFIAATVAAQTRRFTEGLVTTVAGGLILLWSASRGFNEFQDALDTVWAVAPPDGIRPGVLRTIRQRTLSFLLTIAGGVALALYVLVRPAINAFSNTVSPHLPQAVGTANALNAVFAFVLIAAVLATLYRLLPNTSIRWSDVWLASLMVALVLTVGQVVFAVYIDIARQLGFLGAASSPLVVLALTHTAVQAVYWGAAFSRTYAYRYGSKSEATHEESLDGRGLA